MFILIFHLSNLTWQLCINSPRSWVVNTHFFWNDNNEN